VSESHCDRPVLGLAQDPIEIVNYFAYLRENVRQRFREVFDLKSVFVDQYLEGAANIHLHLGNADGWRACMEFGVLVPHTLETDVNEFTVFISVGESMKDEQGRKQVPSFVRLKTLDHCDVFVGEVFETTRSIASEFLRRLIDRKSCVLLLTAAISCSECKNHVIQCDASVQSELANQKARLIPELSREFIERFLSSVQIGLFGSRLECSFPSTFDSAVQQRQLFLCPVYPEMGLAKRAHDEILRRNVLRESL